MTANEFHREFATVHDLIAEGRQERVNPEANDFNWQKYVNDQHAVSWFCGDRRYRTVADAAAAVERGDFDAGRERIFKMAQKIEAPEAVSVRRRVRWADQGDEIDQQKVWAGRLDTAWLQTKRMSARGPQRIRIGIDIGGNCNVKAEELSWRGVAGLVLADRLVEAGHSVEVLVVHASSGLSEGKGSRLSIVVKPFENLLDINALANLTASSCLLRGIIYPWFWQTGHGPVSSWLGQNISVDPAHYATSFADHVFIVPQTCRNERETLAWVTKIINQLNAEARGEEIAA